MSEEFTLPRHGAPPLKFKGEKLSEQDSKSHQGPRQNRWHELALYRTDGGKLVAAVGFKTIWQREEDRETVFVCDNEKALIDSLQHDFDPHAGWQGHPHGVHDGERKNALIAEAVCGGYAQAVADLLASAGIVEPIE